MQEDPAPDPQLVEGRSCDGCTLCCKLAEVKALAKPMGILCRHCEPGRGCTIYETRPDECRVFYCLYRSSPLIGEIWRPRDCHMAMSYEPQATRINVWVDLDFAGAWRAAPYLRQLRQLALLMLRQRGSLIIWEGERAFAVLPDREIDLGPAMGKQIVVMGRDGPAGEEYNVEAWDKNDPRLGETAPNR